jgi:hypothetical protein
MKENVLCDKEEILHNYENSEAMFCLNAVMPKVILMLDW